ncbi:hypothetical protein CYMTET_50170 [Cymbomonas tetramitiformis]|uniref:N-acetyltransferase domain-containing protein n=2 Tax=Cymbomonas tetramitiformis TaxID=36881 RepID=A0AAE0BNP5_9CHLO|nr:hypothetical protein CYMTET_50170 [Cymbomonas tetramitiformis]
MSVSADSGLLNDLYGHPLTCDSLSTLLDEAGGSVSAFELVPGSERRWPQSHSAKLRVCQGDIARTIFLKKVEAAGATSDKPPATLRRDMLSNRCEARFYREFAPVLRARGVHLIEALAVVEQLSELDLAGGKRDGQRGGGVLLLLESAEGFDQASPLTRAQAQCALAGLAQLHAAAWEDRALLRQAAIRLHEGGGTWWALRQRGTEEMTRMHTIWPRFLSAFAEMAPEVTSRPSITSLPERLARLAPWIATELTAAVEAPFATMVHGDPKAANIFLPRRAGDGGGTAVPVDFQWVGLGFGMSDVAYHLSHAVLPDALEAGGGEAELVAGYCAALRSRLPTAAAAAYTDEVATYHYRLALADYARLVLSRFVTDAAPAAFAANDTGPRAANVGVIYRNSHAAVRFVERVDEALSHLELGSPSALRCAVRDFEGAASEWALINKLDEQMCEDLRGESKKPLPPTYGANWFWAHCDPMRRTYCNWRTLTLEVAGAPAGFCLVSRGAAAAPAGSRKRSRKQRIAFLELFWIAVAPALRGQGYGEMLMRRSIETARDLWDDLQEVRLHVMADNASAICFYERAGFVQVALKKDYLPGHDALRMALQLPPLVLQVAEVKHL